MSLSVETPSVVGHLISDDWASASMSMRSLRCCRRVGRPSMQKSFWPTLPPFTLARATLWGLL
jgi:hypothetical protein